MAHKKGMGSTENGRDSISKRLGVKLFGGQYAKAGNIIIRQRGTKYHAGDNTYLGKDFTVHAAIEGTVKFKRGYKNRVFVNVIPMNGNGEVQETVAKNITAKATPTPTPVPPKTTAKTTAKEEKKAAPKAKSPKKEEKKSDVKASKKATSSAKDNLKKVEGIGPKIESLLNAAGIITFAQLADTKTEKLNEILEAAGNRYKMHNPSTWPQQAALAAQDKWDDLKQLQDELKGGKQVD